MDGTRTQVGGMGWERVVRILLMPVALLVGACGTLGGLNKDSPPAEKEKVAAEQSAARWQAILKRDYRTAYAAFSEASQKAEPYEKFRARVMRTAFRDAKVDKVSCQAETCKVRLIVTYDHKVMKGVATPLEETWILENGVLKYVWLQ